MQIKRRGQRAILIESTYVRKGAEGNSHGFTRPRQVCSVDIDATTIPPDVDARLNKEQRDLLMSRVVAPAQRRAAQKRADDEARVTDPGWRLAEALTLVNDAARLSLVSAVPPTRVVELTEALRGVVLTGGSRTTARETTEDPMDAALKAIRVAVKAAQDGHYGRAPSTGVRDTKTYRRWLSLTHALIGENDDSLMRALQRIGFVKMKG
ncbi:MAG: hypothetical protein IH627_13115 [Rubrivivax sp.]|nr:hypothetical protein [Rubrivivax sp.]